MAHRCCRAEGRAAPEEARPGDEPLAPPRSCRSSRSHSWSLTRKRPSSSRPAPGITPARSACDGGTTLSPSFTPLSRLTRHSISSAWTYCCAWCWCVACLPLCSWAWYSMSTSGHMGQPAMGTGTNSFCLGLAKMFTNFSMIAFTVITSVSFVGFVGDAIGVTIALVALVLNFSILRVP